MIAISAGVPEFLLNADATAAPFTGEAKALPAVATYGTWTTNYSVAPGAINIVLEASLDGTTWFVIDTSTAVAGEMRNFQTSATQLRARVVSETGGGNITVSVTMKKAFVTIGLLGEESEEDGGAVWGDVTGTLSEQTDLQTAINARAGLTTNSFLGAQTIVLSNLQTTPVEGLILENTTPATVGITVQVAPRLKFRSRVWNTTAGGASNTSDWVIETVPTTGANPSSIFKLMHNANGAGNSLAVSIDSFGAWVFNSGMRFENGNITINANSRLLWGTTRASIGTIGADAQLTITNNANSIGVGLDVATDNILKVRNRAHNAYATVDALGYRASGVAGVSFGPAAPTSITVVNGIITAIS